MTTIPSLPPSSVRWPLRKEIIIVTLVWVTFFVLTVGRVILDFQARGRPIPPFLVPSLAIEVGFWAAMTPLYFGFAQTFPLTRGRGILRLGVYLVIVIGAAFLADTVLSALVRHLLELTPPPPGRRRPSGFFVIISRINVVNELTFSIAVMGIAVARSAILLNRERQMEEARLVAEKDRLQRQLTEARLSALRMQLNPHFLFNTLHAVSALVDRDPAGVRRMIARLSDLLRRVLDDTEGHETTVANEFAFARDYLAIQQIRFQDDLEIVVFVDSDVSECQVPRLILQPLLENAIHHGVSRLVDRPGRIEISASKENDFVLLSVADNGPGLATDAPVHTSGVGLANSRSRLHELYGKEATLTLSSLESGGTIATVSVPCRHVREN